MNHPDALLDAFAPTGVLRVALNHGNRVLVGRSDEGEAMGISVDLARALADHLGLKLSFVEYERAVDVSSSVSAGVWDVCFLAVDPDRAKTIAFTEPYVRIEGSYLAAPGCDAVDSDALVASGAKVATVKGSAYTLTLSRKPGAENLVTCEDIFAALEALDRGDVAAIAGIGSVMAAEAGKRPGARVLQPPFMEIRQAMAVPQGRPAAHAALAAWLGDMARSGRVGEILAAHGVDASCAIVPA